MEELGRKIVELRKQKGLTQEQLANQLGMSSGAVSKWECGKANPDILLLKPIARIFSVSLEELLNFRVLLSKEEISEKKQEAIRIMMEKGIEVAYEFIKEMMQEYPTQYDLKLSLCSVLLMNLGAFQNEGDKKKNLKVIKEHLLEVISHAQTTLSYTGKYMLAQVNLELEEYEDCENILMQVHQQIIDVVPLYISLYMQQQKFEDVKKMAQQQLLESLVKADSHLLCYLE